MIKTAISVNLARKVFSKRYVLGGIKKDIARIPFDDSFAKVSRSGLGSADKILYDKAQKVAKIASKKTDNSAFHLATREKWAKNKMKYGKTSPTLADIAKQKFGKVIGKIKGLASIEKTPTLAPQRVLA